MNIKILNLLLFILCYSCVPEEDETHHYTITFYNNSDKNVYVSYPCLPCDLDFVKDYDYAAKTCFLEPETYKVYPHSMNRTALSVQHYWYDEPYEFYLKHKTDSMNAYIIDADSLDCLISLIKSKSNSNNISIIQLKDALLQTIKLNINDLRRSNWVIAYPYDVLDSTSH